MDLVLTLQTDPWRSFSRPTTEVAVLACHRYVMQDMRGYAPHGLQLHSVVTLEKEGMRDQYEVDSGVDPEDNEDDAALLL
jgi:hypothetical protein